MTHAEVQSRYKSRYPDRVKASDAKWRAEHPEYTRAIRQASRDRYPERVAAQKKLQKAIRGGRVTRMPCETCGLPAGEAHHDDYSKPLDVRWLCKRHHTEEHYPGVSDR